MTCHPRELVVQQASADIKVALGRVIPKYNLTYGELFSILGECIQNWAKFAIRDERHPGQPDKPGGIA